MFRVSSRVDRHTCDYSPLAGAILGTSRLTSLSSITPSRSIHVAACVRMASPLRPSVSPRVPGHPWRALGCPACRPPCAVPPCTWVCGHLSRARTKGDIAGSRGNPTFHCPRNGECWILNQGFKKQCQKEDSSGSTKKVPGLVDPDRPGLGLLSAIRASYLTFQSLDFLSWQMGATRPVSCLGSAGARGVEPASPPAPGFVPPRARHNFYSF